ncbi:hypothetical protein H2200_007939 [Cladophialophora chaetospira]|uniref:Uncharacterized protein n=1 Tax=Cladophialophora chaetospira TaxID=386627 RepID=A0AA38X6P2_9EURO|nr:hypothetical protein H2200_007939 [Cladophialophora chaetospira]
MKVTPLLLFLPTLPRHVAAQETINLLSIIVSEANSVYTQVNSILSSAASAASAAAASATVTSSTEDASTTPEATPSSTSDTLASSLDVSSLFSPSSTSAFSTSSSSSSSSTSSYASPAFGSIVSSTTSASSTYQTSSSSSSETPSSSITSSPTLSGPIVGTSSVLGATAETSSSVPTSSTSSHHSHLAIILGCVLGALALGFFILALVLCCKRRRRTSSPRHSALSADDDVDAWRDTRAVPFAGPARHSRNVSATAPLMTEHPAYRNDAGHQNPFVPVPPPPRRSPPNSRSNMALGMAPSENPFADGPARPASVRSVSSTNSTHHHKGGLAAGIAAAAAGATLVHQHDKHKEEKATLMHPKAEPLPSVHRQVSRKPVPVHHVNNGEQRPYDPVSPIDPSTETVALAKPARGSGDSRKIFNRDAARANAAFDQQYAPQDGPHSHGDHHALKTGAAGLVAGALGGAALAHHRDQERRRSRSSSSSSSNRRSRPPLAVSGDESDNSNSTGSSGGSRNSRGYSDALVSQPQESALPPQHDPYGVPASRSRRNSAHGAALPGAAAFAHANRPTIPSPLSSEVRHDHRHSTPRSQTRRSSSTPRYSFPYEPMDHEYGAYPPFPGASGNHGYSAALQNEAFPSLADDHTLPISSNPDKAIVGDNGYPHMGVPRRKSGGEYDHTSTGPLGPQILPVAPSSSSEEGSSRNTTMKTLGSDPDSTWRMSQGMPMGWQRASIESPRNSRDLGNRDSGVGMGAGRRRLRVSDITGREDGGGLGQAL